MATIISGSAALGPLTTDAALGQQAEASVVFNDQSTDGSTLNVAKVSTSVDARLLLVAGTNKVFIEKQLQAGDHFTDLTLELAQQITQSRTVRAEVRTPFPEDELLARDRAQITVGDKPQTIVTSRMSRESAA